MAIPSGFSTINPFIICDDADGLFRFLAEVFGGIEHSEARTMDADRLLFHRELQIGGTTIVLAERKPDWPFTPSLLQVYVDDVDATLDRAVAGGASIVTKPTPFFGEMFSRFRDGWGNLWWVYSTPADDAPDWDASEWEAGDASAGEVDFEWSPDLWYIRNTLVETFPTIRDPRRKG